MGVIFRGRDDRQGGQRVAIKTVRSTRVVESAAICREIAVLSRLQHAGIVRLVDHGVADWAPWMAMELLHGRTLGQAMSWYWPETSGGRGESHLRSDELPTAPARRLQEAGTAPAGPLYRVAAGGHLVEALSVVSQLCLALDHIHTNGYVHRDIKPANVFLGRDRRTTLLDFGLVCAAGASTGSELCVGTMEYAAPEQICGDPVDRRTDIYALGCLLYELVTGRLPFLGDSTVEIAEGQMKRDPVPPSQFIADVPSRLESLVMAMLSKSPARRPDRAVEIGGLLASIAQRARQRYGAPGDDGLIGWWSAGGRQARRVGGKEGGRAGGTPGRGPRGLPARPVWGSARVAAGRT